VTPVGGGASSLLAESEPVILLGRGGSGTRILSQLALANGVFIGNELNESQDSVEWVDAIYDLAVECIGSGVVAGSARDAHWRRRLREQACEILEKAGRSPAGLWGWKLPETMLALPQIMRAFPRARIIHLVRHPVTSALRRTHVTSRMDNRVGCTALPASYKACGFDPGVIARDAAYLHNAASWKFQLGSVLGVLDAPESSTNVLQLRYEDVCAMPREGLDKVATFLGRTPPPAAAEPVIEWDRTDESLDADERADRIWSICGPTASRLGYRRHARR
jgi:hypothetical protein